MMNDQMDKASIIKDAIDYIQELQEQERRIEAEIMELENIKNKGAVGVGYHHHKDEYFEQEELPPVLRSKKKRTEKMSSSSYASSYHRRQDSPSPNSSSNNNNININNPIECLEVSISYQIVCVSLIAIAMN